MFPLQEWAFYLLSMATATLSLWVAWMIAGQYLPGEKRVAGLALLTLVPFFNFLAIKYNANSAMTPTWALTTWFFLRSFESRSPGWAALAGLAAAAAMLAKYWAVILLIGLGIAALADPRRARYFRSAAPYVTVAVGAAALAPHLWWLYDHGFAAFGYALESHPATLFEALRSGVVYVASAVGYVAIPVLTALAVARPSRAAIADTLWPADPSRRTVVIAFALPLLLPMLAAVLAREEVIPIWTISTMTLLPVVLLSSPLVRLPRAGTIRILAIAIALPDRLPHRRAARRARRSTSAASRTTARITGWSRRMSKSSGTRPPAGRCASSAAPPICCTARCSILPTVPRTTRSPRRN